MTKLLDTDFLNSIAPSAHAVVQAAAGTGKTWLLTSRIIRILLAGADPGSVLAITFTRKAATEMHERLHERLFAMAAADDAALDALLLEIQVDPTPSSRGAARGLYESWLSALYPLRTTTFHAFCQEILQRFPLESGVPPGFELCEHTGELEAAAWHALDQELNRNPDSAVAQALDTLLRRSGGLHAARAALAAFLRHRGDWWIYTEGALDPVAYAISLLPRTLNIIAGRDPVAALLADGAMRADLAAYAELLSCHTTATHTAWCAAIQAALAPQPEGARAYAGLRSVFFTAQRERRSLKVAKIMIEKLGTDGIARLETLQAGIAQRLAGTDDELRRIATRELSEAWYRCGQRLLAHFQRLKRTLHLLDFTDLEWHTYRLLTHGQHAEWVQYKLDRRIAHLLVDEFQDTNPTQWRLLLPLLAEMSAGENDTARSVFLVGDDKQSIYRFRRAEPKLFHVARDWLTQRARATTYTQHLSRRSSPAIINFVNLIFDRSNAAAEPASRSAVVLDNFQTHRSKRDDLWGIVQVLPLVPRMPAHDVPMAAFRNPLTHPRIVPEDERHRREGEAIASQIQALLARPIESGQARRPLGYGDVMILLRDRTHAAAYEAALRHVGIPYIGAERGGFTRCLEVRDLVQLLTILASAADDVALASVLRSPIFAAGHADLLALARIHPSCTWYERLLLLEGCEPLSPLGRAQHLLPAWKALADRVPVHDLLDRIYFDGDILARYRSASPAHLKERAVANLHRLLTLALELDSGRFPSLARFLAQLEALTAEDSDAAGAVSQASGNAVRIMTIHAAKGLESPVVFLANAAQPLTPRDRGVRALVEWPVEDSKPRYFHLIGNKETLDDVSRTVLARHDAAARREEANLLYVALTRAKQALFVSGCEPGHDGADAPGGFRHARGWYGFIEAQMEQAVRDGNAERIGLRIEHVAEAVGSGTYNVHGGLEHRVPTPAAAPEPAVAPTSVPIDPALTRPFERAVNTPQIRSPSSETDDDDRPQAGVAIELLAEAKRRGVIIHRVLELLPDARSNEQRAAVKARIAQAWVGRVPATLLEDYWQEACAVVDDAALRPYFDASHYLDARNEAALLYGDGGREIYGIIDRLIRRTHEIVIIDYKTHRVNAAERRALTERFSSQVRLYAAGVQRLWPGVPVRALLLYTANREIAEIDLV